MNIEKSILENETILSLGGWLDTQSAEEFEQALSEVYENTEKLELDLKDLEYISSSGVRQVVAAHKKVGGKLVIRNTPDNVFSVFKSIGIDKRIDFE
jgi:anti-anti-sigma factor